ncbi:MAG: hypothetical protein WCJ31_07590 [Planctomycetia bacterium]
MSPQVHAASAPALDGGWGDFLPRIPAQADGGAFRFRQIGLVLVPLLAMVLRVASSPTSALAYLLICAWALTGRRQAIVSLFLCWQINISTHDFCGPPLFGAQFRFLVFFVCAFSVFLYGPSRSTTTKATSLLYVTLPVLLLILLHSMIFSFIADVSLLKSLTFSIVFVTAVCGWSWMSPADRHIAIQTIFGGLMLGILFSFLMKLTGRGMMGGTAFFAGVYYHSQVMGGTAALAATILTVQCLTIRPLRWWRIGLLGVSLLDLYWSGARIALLSYVGAVAIGFIVQMVSSVLYLRGGNPRIVAARLGAAAVLFLLLCVVGGQQLASGAKNFLLKYGEQEDVSLIEQGLSSRQGLIDMMKSNIDRYPLTGIGFGIGSTPELRSNVQRDAILGLPLMATVEKGVLPVMILEELGIPLGFLVYLWIGTLALSATRGGILPISVFATVMLTNIAEAAFLSPGGAGLLSIVLVAWAATEPAGGAWKKHLRARQVGLARRSPFGAPLSPVFAPPLAPALPHPLAPALPHPPGRLRLAGPVQAGSPLPIGSVDGAR